MSYFFITLQRYEYFYAIKLQKTFLCIFLLFFWVQRYGDILERAIPKKDDFGYKPIGDVHKKSDGCSRMRRPFKTSQ